MFMKGRRTSPETSLRRPGEEFPQRVRKALRPLLADDALVERTALKIEKYRNSGWKYSPTSAFFDFEGKVNRVVSHFAPDGLTRESYLRAAVGTVPLFFQKPETLIGNIERVADHFRGDGLTRGAYLRAALKQPHLFYQKPETLVHNIERVVHHFHKDGLTRDKCLRAAVRQPSLFYYRPETIILHINLITGLYRKGLLNLPESRHSAQSDTAAVIEYMLHQPTLFAMSEDNITLRERYARAVATPLSARVLMRSSRRVIEERLAGELAQTVTLQCYDQIGAKISFKEPGHRIRSGLRTYCP
jgi:hypothetical protein